MVGLAASVGMEDVAGIVVVVPAEIVAAVESAADHLVGHST